MTPELPRFPVDLSAAARYYSAEGLRIFPSHYPIFDKDSGNFVRCSCKKAENCPKPGKHPAIEDWPNAASADPTFVSHHWSRDPFFNVSLLCGDGNGFDVLDVDVKDDGPAALARYTECYGPLPPTRSSHTGSGGYHYLFRHVPGLKNNNHGKIAKGLDFRATGGQIIAPPSLHYSGNRYQWENEGEIANMPGWLIDLMFEDPRERRKRRVSMEDWKAIAHGAAPGGRHNSLVQLAALLLGGGPIRSRHLGIALLHAYNEKFCDPEKPKAEIDQIIKYVLNHEIKELDR